MRGKIARNTFLKIAAIAALFVSLNCSADPTTYVQTLDDFRTHMLSHIRRVRLLGIAAFKKNPTLFPDVDTRLLTEFLDLHDQSKVNQNGRFLVSHHLENERRILERLYENYGLDFSRLSPARKEQALALVDRLNQVDHEVAQDFFRSHGMLDASGKPNAIATQYLRIEKLADLVDRGENPVSAEEFHKKMTHTSEMLKTPEDQRIAEQLQQRYPVITRNASYTKYRRVRVERCAHIFELGFK